jgi:hypothetical protein
MKRRQEILEFMDLINRLREAEKECRELTGEQEDNEFISPTFEMQMDELERIVNKHLSKTVPDK